MAMRGASMRWREMKQRLDDYESKKHWPAIVAGATICMVLLVVEKYNTGPAWVILILGIGTAILLGESLAIECPYCGRRIQHVSHVAILRNMHQCPHCQGKFPDEEHPKE